jgi:hypothetical protein
MTKSAMYDERKDFHRIPRGLWGPSKLNSEQMSVGNLRPWSWNYSGLQPECFRGKQIINVPEILSSLKRR